MKKHLIYFFAGIVLVGAIAGVAVSLYYLGQRMEWAMVALIIVAAIAVFALIGLAEKGWGLWRPAPTVYHWQLKIVAIVMIMMIPPASLLIVYWVGKRVVEIYENRYGEIGGRGAAPGKSTAAAVLEKVVVEKCAELVQAGQYAEAVTWATNFIDPARDHKLAYGKGLVETYAWRARAHLALSRSPEPADHLERAAEDVEQAGSFPDDCYVRPGQRAALEALRAEIAAVRPPADPAGKTCPACGQNNAPNKRFCVQCGAPLENALGGTPAPAANPPQPALPAESAPPDVAGLIQEIMHYGGPFPADPTQQERIEQLVGRGPEVVPAISGAVWSVIRYGATAVQLENAGLLCEAIGRIGGPKAHEVLERLESHESGVDRIRPVQLGARRGLATLDNGPNADPLPGLAASAPGPEQQGGLSGGVPLAASAVVAAGSGAAIAGAVGADASAQSQKRDPWTWVVLAGGIFYLLLIVLVFVLPQLPFYLGSLMIAPAPIFMVLAKLRVVNTEQHGGGCLVVLASLVAGLVLYGLLFLFQREFFVQAVQALMDSGS